MLGCARALSEASWHSIPEHQPHSCEVFHSHSCCQQEISNQVEVGLKLFHFLRTCIILYIFYDYAVSLITLSVQLHMFIQTLN